MTRLRIHVNWRIAFEEFKRKHGMEPILTAGRWIFEDGASYAKSPRGPAYEPPADPRERDLACLKYWRLRKAIVDKEAEYLEGLVQSLRGIYLALPDAATNPAFLQVSVAKTNEKGKRLGVERVALNLGDYERNLKRRREESIHCLSKITELDRGEPLKGA